MKEPKFPKLEDIPKDHKYDFFAEGVFPDTEDEKQNKNLGTQKKSRLPFSLPVNAIRKVSNTQKDDDLVPFFAKNYPSSSESKEEVCFINSPSPSDTPDNTGEAEEVDIDESEEDENENNKEKENKDNKNKNEKIINKNKKLILNNEDLGVSIDFNSEMENEYENPSKMMSREEVQELKRIRKLQLEKEEEERKKKEEEEKKKEELKKKKEDELKKKIDEEKKKKEKELKELKEKEKKEKEKSKSKKIEEEKKKKIKSNKKEPLNMLSSIKKNYDDNSNMASNSMINDVQNFFAIPEEKGENEDEDEDTTKKNVKKSIKESEKKSKSKSKKNPKPTTIEEDKDKDKQSKEEDINKDKKNNNKLSRKSNGLKVKEEDEKKVEKKDEKKEEIKSDSEKEEQYSNYGDQLADADSGEKNADIDSDSPPKKQKVKDKKEKKTQGRKKYKKMNKDNTLSQIEIYQIQMGLNGVQKYSYDIVPNKETKTFGNGRYPVRNRVRALRHELGERAIYEFDEDGLPNLKCLDLARNSSLSDSINKNIERIQKKKMKKKLVKGLSNNNNETIPEESNEYNSENLDSENISEFGEDDARILKIPKGGKKSLAKNYDTVLMIKIIEAQGKNLIRVDKKEYKNLKNDNQVKVGKNQEFEILNFSENALVVQLVFDENN